MTERLTISVPDDMAAEINQNLSYGDNRSEWIRDAIAEKLERKPVESQPTSEARETGSKEIQLPDDVPNRINQDDARAAIRAAIEYVESNDGATKKEIIPAVMPEHPLGYDVEAALDKIEQGERYRGAYWRRIIKPGLKQSDRIETPAQHESVWRVG